jgi:hypothetical protein
MARAKKQASFLAEALAADAAVEAGAPLYRARDVHAWLDRTARGTQAAPPAPIRRRRRVSR